MKVNYFPDTDTLLVILSKSPVVETREINENTIIDLDDKGGVVSITIEHAKKQTDINEFSFQQTVEST